MATLLEHIMKKIRAVTTQTATEWIKEVDTGNGAVAKS
jgi:hypothetical protein